MLWFAQDLALRSHADIDTSKSEANSNGDELGEQLDPVMVSWEGRALEK